MKNVTVVRPAGGAAARPFVLTFGAAARSNSIVGAAISEAPSFSHAAKGHSSGTVGGLRDTPTTQKCPFRLARPEGVEPPTLRFEA